MKYAILAFVLVTAAVGGTMFRYGSLDPCVWLEKDMAAASSLPRIAVQAQITLQLGLEPSAYECLDAWWTVRSNGLEQKSSAPADPSLLVVHGAGSTNVENSS